MPRGQPTTLRLGPKPLAKRKTTKRKAATKPAPLPPAVFNPTEPLAGFNQFAATDYTVAVPNPKGETRYLTVSPLRAIMDEQDAAVEHIVTKRTKQGVLYGAGLGMERKVLARIMGLDLPTLESLYEQELATGVHLLMSDIQTNMYNIARDPTHSQSIRSATFLLGKLGNDLYREEKRVSTALTVNPQTRTIDPSLLTDDQRHSLRTILMAAMDLAGGGGQPTEVLEAEYDEVDDGEDLL